MLEEKGSTKGFLLGVLAGGITGGLIALLYAPKSGRELRQDIGKKKDELVGDAEEYIDIAKSKASDIIASSRKKADELISEAKTKAEYLTSGAGKMYTQGKDLVVDEAAKIKDAVRAGVDSYKDERKTRHDSNTKQ
jgi:gas vesicle protein